MSVQSVFQYYATPLEPLVYNKIMLRLFLFLLLVLSTSLASADVIVLDNRSKGDLAVKVSPVTAVPFSVKVEAGDIIPLFVDGKAHVKFATRRGQKSYLLNANSAYYFGNLSNGDVDLQEIGLGGNRATAEGRSLPGSPNTAPVTIAIKIAVDEEEPAHQRVWEQRLRKRIAKASTIFEKYCRLRLKVVAVERWNSDNSETEFFESLAEFEKEVDPAPGMLAIGFTQQYQVPRGRVHLGGTRGLFHSHILVREWSRHVGEPERLELLVHELGHFLGAVHSPEPGSVMRPVLGDRLAIRTGFRIRFDPVNTLAMAMVVEEMRRRNVRKPRKLSSGTTRRIAQIYSSLTGNAPPQASSGERVLKNPRRVAQEPVMPPMVRAVRTVLNEIVNAARENHQLPEAAKSGGTPSRRTGDALTEYYVRRAAVAAQNLPEGVAPKALVVALGIGIDQSSFLRKLPKTKELVTLIEPAGQRSVRMAFLGKPAMHDRTDLAQHFLVSAFLTAVQSRAAAEAAGLAKELLDSRRTGSGFSFADLAADKAGVEFGEALLEGRITIAQVANDFTVVDYLSSIDDLPEGLSFQELLSQFGQAGDGRFQQQLAKIDERILALPIYQAAPAEESTDGSP